MTPIPTESIDFMRRHLDDMLPHLGLIEACKVGEHNVYAWEQLEPYLTPKALSQQITSGHILATAVLLVRSNAFCGAHDTLLPLWREHKDIPIEEFIGGVTGLLGVNMVQEAIARVRAGPRDEPWPEFGKIMVKRLRWELLHKEQRALRTGRPS